MALRAMSARRARARGIQRVTRYVAALDPAYRRRARSRLAGPSGRPGGLRCGPVASVGGRRPAPAARRGRAAAAPLTPPAGRGAPSWGARPRPLAPLLRPPRCGAWASRAAVCARSAVAGRVRRPARGAAPCVWRARGCSGVRSAARLWRSRTAARGPCLWPPLFGFSRCAGKSLRARCGVVSALPPVGPACGRGPPALAAFVAPRRKAARSAGPLAPALPRRAARLAPSAGPPCAAFGCARLPLLGCQLAAKPSPGRLRPRCLPPRGHSGAPSRARGLARAGAFWWLCAPGAGVWFGLPRCGAALQALPLQQPLRARRRAFCPHPAPRGGGRFSGLPVAAVAVHGRASTGVNGRCRPSAPVVGRRRASAAAFHPLPAPPPGEYGSLGSRLCRFLPPCRPSEGLTGCAPCAILYLVRRAR